MKSCNELNMSIEYKNFYNKILLDMKTFEVTIDQILVYSIGSKLGLYVSFLIHLYQAKTYFNFHHKWMKHFGKYDWRCKFKARYFPSWWPIWRNLVAFWGNLVNQNRECRKKIPLFAKPSISHCVYCKVNSQIKNKLWLPL